MFDVRDVSEVLGFTAKTMPESEALERSVSEFAVQMSVYPTQPGPKFGLQTLKLIYITYNNNM